MSKLRDYADLTALDTMRVAAVSPDETLRLPRVHGGALLLRRLSQRAQAFGLEPGEYLDMVTSDDYQAWLRWQGRQGSEVAG